MYYRTQLIERLGLLSDDILDKAGSPLDTLSNHLAGRLAYGVGERDMILMRHEVIGFANSCFIFPLIASKINISYIYFICNPFDGQPVVFIT